MRTVFITKHLGGDKMRARLGAVLLFSNWLAVSFALLLSSCGGGGSSAGGGGGSLSLSITDAAVDSALQVVVVFTGVQIQPSEGARIDIDYSVPKQIDLLALSGGETELLLEGQSLPVGRYNWIRLEVDETAGYIDVGAGEEELRIPSGANTGLKLNRGFTVQENGATAFTIDFDLRKSVTLSAGGYKLRPTLRIVDNSEVGSLMGVVDNTVVSANCADANLSAGAVYLFEDEGGVPDDVDGDNGDPIATALVELDADANYAYKIAFLPDGDYQAAYTCDAVDDEPHDPDDGDSEDDALTFIGATSVTINAGATTVLNF